MSTTRRSLRFSRWLVLLLVFSMLYRSISAAASTTAPQGIQQLDQASVLLSKMSPEERVGQLFLVTFNGSSAAEGSAIAELIQKKHIGGVLLTRKNNNFVEPDTIGQALRLVTELQQAEEIGTNTNLEDPVSGSFFSPQYVPLFIGLSQEGDLGTYEALHSGLTPMPSQLSIGATWNTDMAQQAGRQLGAELSELGVNLLLGPDLDVFDILRSDGESDQATRTFGADPFWVGTMGSAYISGLHEGSQDRLAAIAKHFPGTGSSDRASDVEVATVKKSIDLLNQIDMAPFLAVTKGIPDGSSTTDGLMITHTRYEGLQGTVTANTKPVSLDGNAIDQLFSMPELQQWQAQGGLVVSDNLGSTSLRRFYDPLTERLDARQVARDAFLAGNDLLMIDDFIGTGFADQYATISDTIDFFAQKYREDAAFAQRVDESVRRILALKYRLYPVFSIEDVMPAAEPANIGKGDDVSFSIIQSGATLISPGAAEVTLAVPQAPRFNDRIVFITDSATVQQCDNCAQQPVIAVNAFQNSVLKLYGPQGSGQVAEYRLSSYTTSELNDYLNNQDTSGKIEGDLSEANWIVFAMFNNQSLHAQEGALHRFMALRPQYLAGKKLIAFTFSTPVKLDSTDVSKLTAYYGLYSRIPVAIEVATRILFREITPKGSPPISIPGVAYDLAEMVKPDPRQVIPLSLDMENYRSLLLTPAAPETPATAPEIPTFDVGDSIPVITGTIVDRNQRKVPDGTHVRFSFVTTGETENVQQVDTVTVDGVAQAIYRITNRGVLEIKAAADPAMSSQILRLNIVGGVQAAITVIAPTTIATTNNNPTPTAPEPTHTPVAQIEPVTRVKPTWVDWMLTMLFIIAIGAGFFGLGSRIHNLRWGVRWGSMSVLGGVIAYIMIVEGVFGLDLWGAEGGFASVIAFILLGCVLGWFLGYLWQSLTQS